MAKNASSLTKMWVGATFDERSGARQSLLVTVSNMYSSKKQVEIQNLNGESCCIRATMSLWIE